MSCLENMHQGIKLSETIWKDFGKASNFATVSTEMSMYRKGQHICKSQKLQCKTIHVSKNTAENEATNPD